MNTPQKLGDNEQLLPDGRILIRGSLRPDGTRRPDRYKRAGFSNDEDKQRNKYIPKGVRQRMLRSKQKEKEQTKQAKMNPVMEQKHNVSTKDYVQSLVATIINNPPKPVPTDNNGLHGLNVDFNENVLKPLIHGFYNENEQLLAEDVTKWLTRDSSQCQQWIDNGSLRMEVIRYIHKLSLDLNSRKHPRNTSNAWNITPPTVRGRGNVSFGSGKMFSEKVESQKRAEHPQKEENKKDNKHKKRKRGKVRRLNQKYKEIRELEQRRANGEMLKQEQIAKINSKEDILSKLKDLKIGDGQ